MDMPVSEVHATTDSAVRLTLASAVQPTTDSEVHAMPGLVVLDTTDSAVQPTTDLAVRLTLASAARHMPVSEVHATTDSAVRLTLASAAHAIPDLVAQARIVPVSANEKNRKPLFQAIEKGHRYPDGDPVIPSRANWRMHCSL